MNLTRLNAKTELQQLRIRYGITQKDLSKKTGIQEATISRIELGVNVPSVLTMHKLLKFFKTLETYGGKLQP